MTDDLREAGPGTSHWPDSEQGRGCWDTHRVCARERVAALLWAAGEAEQRLHAVEAERDAYRATLDGMLGVAWPIGLEMLGDLIRETLRLRRVVTSDEITAATRARLDETRRRMHEYAATE